VKPDNVLRFKPLGPIFRISFGLMALLVSLVLLADLLINVTPSRDEETQRMRKRVAENLAMQIVSLVEVNDMALLGKTVQRVLARDADIRSIVVRRNDGSTLLHHGEAEDAPRVAGVATAAGVQPVSYVDPDRGASSTLDHLRVPINAGRDRWGEIDVRFAPAAPQTWRHWIAQPSVQMLALFAFGGFALVYVYLRRAMQYLNPSASVPARVRTAFDSFAEGLLILDQESRIVLANRAFRTLHPKAADGELNGRKLGSLDWLMAPDPKSDNPPLQWQQALKSTEPIADQPLSLLQPAGAATQLLVSSSPITDDKGRRRGCLITFDDVTAVHRANHELRTTLAELERSRQRIDEQNNELRTLASRDPLTGCLNRRAFFDVAADLFKTARSQHIAMCCLMVDIDHFKQFNDRYGHAIGDQVIQVVSRALSAGLRQADVLCRYGGEEFCIVLPGATPQVAMEVAERLRAEIENNASAAVRDTDVMPITASFGLATLSLGAYTLEALIDQADQALYQAKQSGRNRVTAWKHLRVVEAV
jgi:diguanylate cyclase (GGDEF)-like protein/PAS domain S-box-containing protein